MRIDFRDPDWETLRIAARIVGQGGLVLYPTDTIYGLGCDPSRPDALRRLLSVKGRPEGKGMLVLIRSLEQLSDLVSELPGGSRPLLERFWPGPLTVLLEAAPGVPGDLLGPGGKIGIRLPACRFLDAWLELLAVPLVSTSANRSGETYSGSPELLRELFEDQVDLLLDAGELPSSRPSTVVDLTERPFRIVRSGEMASQVARFLSGVAGY